MTVQIGQIRPEFLNMDSDYEKLAPNESPFIKGLSRDFNYNANLNTGTGNGSPAGQNEYALTPTKSNEPILGVDLPEGRNRTIGSFESIVTREAYIFNFNNNQNFGIYVINGDTGQVQKVIVDPLLGFSEHPEHFIAEHRVRLRVKYDAQRNIIEKYLIITDGNGWQKWINVVAAIATNGYDASLFAYYTLLPPHFDRRELLEYATRPSMIAPDIVSIANTPADNGTLNRVLDSGFEFAYNTAYTDGRETSISPLSLPYFVKTSDFLSNPNLIPKKALITLDAGSCMVEAIYLYMRSTKKKTDAYESNIAPAWGDWHLYDIIYKYNNCGDNSFDVVGNKYWLRKNKWASNSYDPIQNTIQYVFDNSLEGQITDQDKFSLLQNDIPQISVGLTDLGDAICLANNRRGYDNFPCSITDKFTFTVEESNANYCPIPNRKIRLYAYIGYVADNDAYVSQIGYFNGTDTQVRFGGLYYDGSAVVNVSVNENESKYFNLDFADKSALCVYLKGTPYYAVGQWYQVDNNFQLTKIDNLLDISNDSYKSFVSGVLNSGGYFVCVFDLVVPAGRYIATLGRHNVALTADFRSQSTYTLGIADSRAKSIFGNNVTVVRPNALVDRLTKEIEIDCTAGDIDVWGNGHDMFYVFCPTIRQSGNGSYRFIEGYLREDRNSQIPVEDFPYFLSVGSLEDGRITDKNGFYFSYTRAPDSIGADIIFQCRLNCSYPIFLTQPTNGAGIGYRPNNLFYISDHNNNQIGFGNYVILTGRVTDLTGVIGYSNIAITIVNGETVYTDDNGNYTLRIHNGQSSSRADNVYINSGGDFLITGAGCGFLPLIQYNESNIGCTTLQERIYPFHINYSIQIQNSETVSLKSNASYSVGIVGADYAGRVTFVNNISTINVPSFDQRNDVLATYVQWAISGALGLNNILSTADIKWLSFYITKATNYRFYIQWVGDKIEYIDINGNVTTNVSSAVLVRITIDSLLQANLSKNLSLLSTYQFNQGDRLRIYDDGNGNLFNTTTYGDMIDVEIQGSNYNQAAINANLIPPASNTVLSTTQVGDNPTTLYVRYDSRFNKLQDDTAFWIELYTPSENNDRLPSFQIGSFYPIINGEIAQFTGYDANAKPSYNFLTTDKLNYWDTYFLRRSINIATSGNKFFNHPFESPNITDTWGANISSGGKGNAINPVARQLWFDTETAKSNDFVNENYINGLGTFSVGNRKSFKGYWWGGIVCIKAINSIILFLCENDFFLTTYNYHYTYPDSEGRMVTNLDNGISEPHQKIGDNYGCRYEHTATIIIHDKFATWHDQKNEGYILCDYKSATDITQIVSDDRKIGIKSYYTQKTKFIGEWNNANTLPNWFDIIAGIDLLRNNIYISFRPRRNNTSSSYSFINERRNVQLDYQETFVYSLDLGRWRKTESFVPEFYGKLRGEIAGQEMFCYSNGIPYKHNNSSGNSFLNFFSVNTEPVIIYALNAHPELSKILQSISVDINGIDMWSDFIYSTIINTYSFIPLNYMRDKDSFSYSPVLRNMNSYPPADSLQNFRSMIVDGGRIYGIYFILRLIGDLNKPNSYFQLTDLFYKYLQIENSKQK